MRWCEFNIVMGRERNKVYFDNVYRYVEVRGFEIVEGEGGKYLGKLDNVWIIVGRF